MTMKNVAEELAMLDALLIQFQIYKIKRGQSKDLMILQMRRSTWVNMKIHVVDEEVEDIGNQTTKEMTKKTKGRYP